MCGGAGTDLQIIDKHISTARACTSDMEPWSNQQTDLCHLAVGCAVALPVLHNPVRLARLPLQGWELVAHIHQLQSTS